MSWDDKQLDEFLRLRQELFLDPLGSNRKRFEEAAVLLQRALFAWYFSKPGEFPGLLASVLRHADETRQLRKDELFTLRERRFSLNCPSPEIPAIESGVSENQWQKIFGSFNTGYEAQRLFERFLTDLDEYTNPSLRINHRYLGELLPHDNMVSYFAATVATFLNENAVIGKVSPCVTHMEQAAMMRLAEWVGWSGKLEIDDSPGLPLQRLPTPYTPSQAATGWEREEPTGTIVGDGTIANISAMLIARNATFDYLLGWGEATQTLGPNRAWEIIQEVYGYRRMVVVTSKGAHYSVVKACHMAGIGPLDVIEARGSKNPWILDKEGLEKTLEEIEGLKAGPNGEPKDCLLLSLILIAGKTETGYVDRIEEAAKVLDPDEGNGVYLHADLKEVWGKEEDVRKHIEELAEQLLTGARYQELKAFRKKMLLDSYKSARKVARRIKGRSGVRNASYNRPFLHVDAAHGGAFLAVPSLRHLDFKGIHLADTVTLDGHKMFYCYYPCGGLLIRTTRWAQTLHAGQSRYISEEANHEAYAEDRAFLGRLNEPGKEARKPVSEMPLIYPGLLIGRREMMGLEAIRSHNSRPAPPGRSELRHHPYTTSLEGSRGCQGIMQMYFNLSTIGFQGYELLLSWTYLLARRCAEAVSLGRTYVRPVTDEKLPTETWMGNAQDRAIQYSPQLGKQEPRRVVPVFGGRLLLLSNGSCNQLLISYVPQNIAKLMSSEDANYWSPPDDGRDTRNGESRALAGGAEQRRTKYPAKPGRTKFWETMHYLWRVNEHLWLKYLYANPAFTYYVGHTEFEPILPNKKDAGQAARELERLLCEWNVWMRWKETPPDEALGADGENWHSPFFQVLAEEVRSSADRYDNQAEREEGLYTEGLVRFFAHKIVIMHPYTDESILSDLLGKIMFWGERSADAVEMADAACQDWLSVRPDSDRRNNDDDPDA